VKVCVLGLGHLGCVTAACLTELGHEVVGVDFDSTLTGQLSEGIAPVAEPGLDELLRKGLAGRLRFTAAMDFAAKTAEVLWVAYDTPVDQAGNADPEFVAAQVGRALEQAAADPLVVISSQLPVGSIRRLEQEALRTRAGRIRVACCPENLRLGSAVADFLHPGRIVAGVRTDRDRHTLAVLLGSITASIEWMSIESAEMTKHAINAFLAASVVFANEIASICEAVGADAKEVERGLKSEPRIGPRAYVSPGSAFSGVTLARDVKFLNQAAHCLGISTPLLSAIVPSNHAHEDWARAKLQQLFGNLRGRTVAIWGLAYKSGTESLQGSAMIRLCDWLLRCGATIRVHDPAVQQLPGSWGECATLCPDAMTATRGANALVVGAALPEHRALSLADLQPYPDLVVLDANRAVPGLAAPEHGLRYFAVGFPGRT
jgi:UDPglucose 6-dehydrogenase